MKKILLAMLLISGLLLSGCGNAEPEIVIIPSQNENSQETPAPEGSGDNDADIIEAQGEEALSPVPQNEAVRSVKPQEAYDQYGYVHFKAEKTGRYSFEILNSPGIEWEVYVLDEEFNDAERYIPQVYEPVLQGSGEAEIQEGKFIYVYSGANSWTMLDIPEGAVCEITFLG